MDYLMPGDVLLSWKQPEHALWPPRALLERFGHWRLRKYGEKLYPSGDVRYDHVRIVCGAIYPDAPRMILGFEFTQPSARFFWFPEDPEHWMYGAEYSKLFRPTEQAMTSEFKSENIAMQARKMFVKCLPWNGSLYDVGQLLDINFNLHRFFDLGKRNHVCSSGARAVLEGGGVLIPNLFPEVKLNKTPPCSFANSKFFEAVV
jgi:hypothetical protein